MSGGKKSSLSYPIEFPLPSLGEIEQIDRLRAQAIEALEISGNSVKCQRCGIAMPLLKRLTKSKSKRITTLQYRIKWLEQGTHYYYLLFTNCSPFFVLLE